MNDCEKFKTLALQTVVIELQLKSTIEYRSARSESFAINKLFVHLFLLHLFFGFHFWVDAFLTNFCFIVFPGFILYPSSFSLSLFHLFYPAKRTHGNTHTTHTHTHLRRSLLLKLSNNANIFM